jgi:hypothetical protein
VPQRVRYHSAEDSTLNASPPISENYFLRHRATIEYLPSLDGQITDLLSSPSCKNIFVFT